MNLHLSHFETSTLIWFNHDTILPKAAPAPAHTKKSMRVYLHTHTRAHTLILTQIHMHARALVPTAMRVNSVRMALAVNNGSARIAQQSKAMQHYPR